jgi:creatinine amidohydrolase/Fe(II)-dependent formamide hydrolase-like protein
MRQALIVLLVGLVSASLPALAAAQDSVFLEELTWTEVRDGIRAGKTTVIIPTGGTEQNGPHMILGKHNIRMRFAAGEIATRLGDAFVAPVMAYVPEGGIAPPTGHMWAPGTITLPAEHFAKVVEFAARSLAAHGIRDIVLIGDSGPNQAPLKAVADVLNKEWASTAVRVHHASAYYESQVGFRPGPKAVADNFVAWLKAQGETAEDIGTHAGLGDTSLLLAVYPQGVRPGKLAPGRPGDGSGVTGDPTKASAAYGKKGLDIAIQSAVRQIRELRVASRKR